MATPHVSPRGPTGVEVSGAPTATIADRELTSAAPILSRESRRSRPEGMGLVVVALVAFRFFVDASDRQQLVESGGRSRVPWIALVLPVAANVFVLGLILLLAGLRELSLRTNVRARRGALARIGAGTWRFWPMLRRARRLGNFWRRD